MENSCLPNRAVVRIYGLPRNHGLKAKLRLNSPLVLQPVPLHPNKSHFRHDEYPLRIPLVHLMFGSRCRMNNSKLPTTSVFIDGLGVNTCIVKNLHFWYPLGGPRMSNSRPSTLTLFWSHSGTVIRSRFVVKMRNLFSFEKPNSEP